MVIALTADQIASIHAMSARGTSEHYIRNVFGITRGQLRRALEAEPVRSRRGKKAESAEIDMLLGQGMGPTEVAARAIVPLGYVIHRQKARLRGDHLETSTDSSSPRFAFDEECVAAVMAHGGFPRIERVRGYPVLIDGSGRPWREIRT